ncbi:MAG: hypothetical protein BZY79_03395 [SAR202 cluster bacterium Casp-Chloro-G4]|nr:anti-sigma factor [Chloroflexota bacterium]MDA1227121.1 anti-sigma factor [Chloroflexota bacterium]PKB61496.1 MAG: hypothetical protein BZY79_03395 [SAR202 cluster bacterium Casp-Chloro-G4]
MSKLLIIFGLVLLMTVPVSLAQAQVPAPTSAGAQYEGSGTAVVSDSSGLSDKITFSMTGVTRPGPDQTYEGWLVNSTTGDIQSTGVMKVDGSNKISHSWVSPDGDNLIEMYNSVVISVEPVPDSSPDSPSSIKPFSGSVSSVAMTHIRHLLVSWPEGSDAGILTNLNGQIDVAIQHVNLARGSSTIEGVLTHTQHVINVVDGSGGPSDGIGIVAHAKDRSHAGLAGASVATEAAKVEAAGANAEAWALEAKEAAENVLDQSSVTIAKALLNTVAGRLDAARNGISATGRGGGEQAYVSAQMMATYSLSSGDIGTPATGDTSIPMLAQMLLAGSLSLLVAGSFLFYRSRRVSRVRA